MTLKLKDVLSIQELYSFINDQSLPIQLAYKFTKLFNALDVESEFYNKQLQNIINHYGERDENNELVTTDQGYKIQPDQYEVCSAEINRLLELEVQINAPTFTLEELSVLNLTLAQMQKIFLLIEEKEDN